MNIHTTSLLFLLSGCALLEYEDTATPALTILSPEEGSSADTETAVLLSASVTDGSDALVKLSVAISSDLDGELCLQVPGTTGIVECDALLTEGVHVLTFTATDFADNTDTQTVTVAIGDAIIGDADGDGYTADDGDCDDDDADIFPGADEYCDDVDNDCDGDIDEDPVDPDTFYADADGDGYGDAAFTATACAAPSGYTDDDTDCDDADATTWPGAPELFDGIDNDCDDEIDEGTDTDDDGDGFSEVDGDCNDADTDIFPGADEYCDDVDNDCDGDIDEEALDLAAFYSDNDGDGYGDPSLMVFDCTAPSGFVDNDTDCDDGNPDVNPGVEELACPESGDGLDNDCDGTFDEGDIDTFFADTDADGFGDAADSIEECDQPSGYVADDTDCDDADADANPDGAEVTDGVDNDCDGLVDEWDGTWSGTIAVEVTGTDKGTCEDSATMTVDKTAKVVIIGSGECSIGLFEGIVFEGDFSSDPDAAGSLEATLAGKISTEASWNGIFTDDDFTASFSGSESDGKDSWSYTGELLFSR